MNELEGIEKEISNAEDAVIKTEQRGIWLRFLYMILFFIIFSFSESAIALITLVAFIFRVLGKPVPSRLLAVGRMIARYLEQIILFLTFNTEQCPFPFSRWPSDAPGSGTAESANDASS